MTKPCPKEDDEQIAFIDWLEQRGIPYWHTNNEMWTNSIKQVMRAKAMGVQSGIPDLFICFPHQLVGIEMKRKYGGVVSENQKYWANIIEQCDIPVWVAHGCDEAIEVAEKYLHLGKIDCPPKPKKSSKTCKRAANKFAKISKNTTKSYDKLKNEDIF